MVWKGELKGGKDFKKDQKDVLNEYFNGCGRVVVSAGAGTGKTTLLVEIVSEAVVRLLKEDPNHNPFEKILAVTFTVEATRQMKTKIKNRLEEHFSKVAETEKMKDISRWIENESWILTLDSLTRSLVSEIAYEIGLSSISVIPDEYELGQIIENIIEEITSNPDFSDEIQLLERAFPNQEWRGDRGWITLLEDSFQQSRMYCLSADEFENNAFNTFENRLYLGYKPPFNKAKINEIYRNLRNGDINIDPKRVDVSYKYNKQILEAFVKLLKEYERLYDEKTKQKGWLGHDDARYWLVRYAEGKIKNANYRKEWIPTQKNRFRHILVDEFQDTSYAQCALLKYFIGDNTSVFLIGDPKQAIYQWRSAEPEIFIEIIKSIKERGMSKKIPFLNISGFKHYELTSNFRSHPCLINMFNDIFGENEDSIFNNSFYTGNKHLPHGNLQVKTELPRKRLDEPHIHIYDGDCKDRIPAILEAIQNKKYKIHVRDKNDDGTIVWRDARLGDCCILMQSRSKWKELRQKLIERRINYVMIAEKGLFQRPEISLIIDVLDWLANPHNKDSLIRILRSPVVGLSERALRFLAYHDFNIYKSLKDDEKPKWFNGEAVPLLDSLVKLRDDLRWLREGRKIKMIEEILKYSHLDSILLSHIEGDQYLANIWSLLDIISSWEQEELLSYTELVERLKYYRESGEDAYNMAALADEEDKNSVKIATVHATKGLEFPIVFIYYPQLDIFSRWKHFLPNKKTFIKKQGKFILLRQISPAGENPKEWEEKYLLPQLSLDISPPYKLFDSFNIDDFSEKWRLYYVALTRAKDHIFHSNKASPRGRNFRFCWQNVFQNWLDRNTTNNCLRVVDFSLGQSPKKEDKIDILDFKTRNYNILKERESVFIPRTINPSHLYDLIFCPRRYQYVVLQQVSGGYSCSNPKKDKKVLRFGTRLHHALELRDFTSEDPNKEYCDYMQVLEKIDKKSADEVKSAVDNFMRSNFFKNYKLDTSRTKKEMEILFKIGSDSNPSILMKDKIDLIIENKDGVVVLDYKTEYPEGDDLGTKYIKKHYQYQLQAYVLALEKNLGLDVLEAIILYYDGTNWIKHTIDADTTRLEKEILDNIEIKVVDGGLERRSETDFCKSYCEFFGLCKNNFLI